ncbi:MAG: CRTAC1 family protein [Holophagales bacterium]|nr:CRTAC1 family protein [Holophagales bacterium]MYC10655.1 CRTAC1 family protein [Holophagales bacterium]
MVLSLIALAAFAAPAQELAAGDGIRFVDVADAWGVRFRHRNGAGGDFYMIETLGSGVVAFDYDGDGDDDLLFVDSGQPEPYGEEPGTTTLLRNDLGRFTDVTEASGLHLDGYGMGAVAGDVDGDGDADLYLTAFGRNRLWFNDGDGTFSPAPQEGAAPDPSWSASAALGDVDIDGDLDLYVTNYVDFGYDNNRVCGVEEAGRRSYCHPDVYGDLQDRFYRNELVESGSAAFVDRTADAGIAGVLGAGLGVVMTDLDGDRRPDIYVANDMDANLHFLNRSENGVLRFVDDALLAGTALSHRGLPEAGMGIAVGDVDSNGFDDLVVTHLDRETNALYANRGDGVFLDQRFTAGIAGPSQPFVGFGVDLADFDLDGDLDLAIANGHVLHDISDHAQRPSDAHAQPNQILENHGSRFREVQSSGLSALGVSRGLVSADLDLDGDLDLAIANCNGPAEVYANESVRRGVSFRVDLFDRGSPNRRAIGAVLELRAGSGSQRREIRSGSSYLSQNSLTQTFGLPFPDNASDANGETAGVRLDVLWLEGAALRLVGLPSDSRVRVVR